MTRNNRPPTTSKPRSTDPRHTNTYRKNRALLKAQGLPCWLCGQPIDYTLDRTDPNHFQADHVYPIETHPELALDPANLKAAHASCNKQRGSKAATPSLGNQSRNW